MVFSTGRLSPVMGAWLMVELPAVTSPSRPIRSPGRTLTNAPTATVLTSTSSHVPSTCCTVARSGVRSIRPPDSISRSPIQRLRSDQLGDRKEEHDHGRFWPLPNQHRTGHRDTHQRIDVQVAVLQRDPALFIGRQAAQQNGEQRRRQPQPSPAQARQSGSLQPIKRPPRIAPRATRPSCAGCLALLHVLLLNPQPLA